MHFTKDSKETNQVFIFLIRFLHIIQIDGRRFFIDSVYSYLHFNITSFIDKALSSVVNIIIRRKSQEKIYE